MSDVPTPRRSQAEGQVTCPDCGDVIEVFRQRLNPEAATPVPSGQEEGKLRCADCQGAYSKFPLDTTIPDDQWLAIMGKPGGILCASCMVRRAAKLIPGVIALRACFESRESFSLDSRVAHYMALPYTKVLKRDDDGDVIASIAELSGCVTHGGDEIAALLHLREMQAMWLTAALDAGQSIPEPSDPAPLEALAHVPQDEQGPAVERTMATYTSEQLREYADSLGNITEDEACMLARSARERLIDMLRFAADIGEQLEQFESWLRSVIYFSKEAGDLKVAQAHCHARWLLRDMLGKPNEHDDVCDGIRARLGEVIPIGQAHSDPLSAQPVPRDEVIRKLVERIEGALEARQFESRDDELEHHALLSQLLGEALALFRGPAGAQTKGEA